MAPADPATANALLTAQSILIAALAVLAQHATFVKNPRNTTTLMCSTLLMDHPLAISP